MERNVVHREPDPSSRWDRVAHAAAAALGDIAVVTRVVPEENVLEVVAVCHRSAELERTARRVLGERYRPGEQLPGRVWQSERGIWIVDLDNRAVVEMAMPASRRYVQDVGLQSIILVPLWIDGRVAGTLGVARDPGRPPYTESDFDVLAAMAVLEGA